jgi:hypothetical protein
MRFLGKSGPGDTAYRWVLLMLVACIAATIAVAIAVN